MKRAGACGRCGGVTGKPQLLGDHPPTSLYQILPLWHQMKRRSQYWKCCFLFKL